MRRPTYANLTATLALVVALGGTAYAAGLPKNSVGTPQLKQNAVTSAKLKGGTVAPSDLSTATKKLAMAGPASVATGSVRGLQTNSSGTSFARGPLQGVVTPGESLSRTVTPDVPVAVSHFTVRIEKDLVAGATVTVGLHVADNPNITEAPTSFTCTITGTAALTDTGCDVPGSLVIPAASFVWIRYDISGTVQHVADPGSGYTGMVLRPTS